MNWKNYEVKMFQKLRQYTDNTYPILVVATMSSGKSALINALIGKELLPSRNTACTARTLGILNRPAADGFAAHCIDAHGHYVLQKDVTKKMIAAFNSSTGYEEMLLEGRLGRVRSPSRAALLIDTPGINNSMDLSHAASTYDTLNYYNEGIILYIINAQQIGTYDDGSFLKMVAGILKRKPKMDIIFAVNKFDLIDPQKETPYEAIESCKNYIESFGIKSPSLIPVSASGALLFQKALSGAALSEFEEEDFVNFYTKFKNSSYLLNKFAIIGGYNNFGKSVRIDDTDYPTEDIYAALINTGIALLEDRINEALSKLAGEREVKSDTAQSPASSGGGSSQKRKTSKSVSYNDNGQGRGSSEDVN